MSSAGRSGSRTSELRDLADHAERGLEIGRLDDGEVLRRVYHSEEALDGAVLGLDDLVDLLEVLGGLLKVLPAIGVVSTVGDR